jgi:large subunit ribosomal protein L3
MLSSILGRKVGMTQIFGPNGTAIPATVIEAGPCTVTQIKSAATDGYEAVQIGFETIRPDRAKRPMLGHLGHTLKPTERQRKRQQQDQAKERQKARESAASREAKAENLATETEADESEASEAASGASTKGEGKGESAASAGRAGRGRRRRGASAGLGPFRFLREVQALESAASTSVKLGDIVDVSIFRVGEEVDIIGTSKGKGFAGVMKRHGFHGGQRTHGQSDRLRAPGSIGAGNTPGRVLKGTRMAGHMGNERVTVSKLEVLQADAARHLLVIKGSVPGANGGMVMVRKIAGQTQLLAHLKLGDTPEREG